MMLGLKWTDSGEKTKKRKEKKAMTTKKAEEAESQFVVEYDDSGG